MDPRGLPELTVLMALSGRKDLPEPMVLTEQLDHKDRKGLLDLPEQMVLMVHRDPKEIKVTREVPVLPDPKGLPEPMVLMAP